MKVSTEWLEASGAAFGAGEGRSGLAHLTHYSAAFCEWGEGPPLVLVPGLAGGYELLGPLAKRLARHYLENFTDGVDRHQVTGDLANTIAAGEPLLPPDFDKFSKFVVERRAQLLVILRKSIELNEPLECSL